MKFVAGFIGLWGNCGIIWGNEWQGNAMKGKEKQRVKHPTGCLSGFFKPKLGNERQRKARQ
jgi:hypothetical protein